MFYSNKINVVEVKRRVARESQCFHAYMFFILILDDIEVQSSGPIFSPE